jgi:crotonobetainyl-CoA:carnitine CoA-transferase CaiB-like acyl-CoA transferase
VSAPLCSRTLADLGARVIKVENPRGGDFARDYDDVVHGLAAHFVWLNRGKESVALDLKDARGRDLLDRLLARADVLLSNLAPGATTRIGIDPQQLAERHPHLVSLEISGYGTGGPLSGKRAYDLLVQASTRPSPSWLPFASGDAPAAERPPRSACSTPWPNSWATR